MLQMFTYVYMILQYFTCMQMFSHAQRGGVGGCNNVPDDLKTVAHKRQVFVRCNRWGRNNWRHLTRCWFVITCTLEMLADIHRWVIYIYIYIYVYILYIYIYIHIDILYYIYIYIQNDANIQTYISHMYNTCESNICLWHPPGGRITAELQPSLGDTVQTFCNDCNDQCTQGRRAEGALVQR